MTITKNQIKPFSHEDRMDVAFLNCFREGYRPLFMPELIEERIRGTASFDDYTHTPSLKVTGITKQGSAVVVYAHVPTDLVTPTNIRRAGEGRLIGGAAPFPQKKFQDLVDRADDAQIWVVDHERFPNDSYKVVSIEKALEHPQTIPFIGNQKRAERYFRRHKELSHDEIPVHYDDDLNDEGPLARLLSITFFNGFVGGDFGTGGQFYGMRDKIR